MEYIKEEADPDHSHCYHDKYSTYTSNQAEKTSEIHNYSHNINSVYNEQRRRKTETLDSTNSMFNQEYLPYFNMISTLNIKEQTVNESHYQAYSLPSPTLHYTLEEGKRNIDISENETGPTMPHHHPKML